MSKTKVLNLYAGIGGNRKLWENVDVTAVEIDSTTAEVYQDYFPADTVVVADAHKFLLDHYKEYDFIWSSPPCPTHSRTQIMSVFDESRPENQSRSAVYPDMKLYQEIILLQRFGDCDWVVENVVPYYDTLIDAQKIGRHLFWSNYHIDGSVTSDVRVHDDVAELQSAYGFDLSGYDLDDKRKRIRNCVDPRLGKHVFESRTTQDTLPGVEQ